MLHCIINPGRLATRRRVATGFDWTIAMSVHSADSHVSFHLPSMGYIDTRWEEQDPPTPTAASKVARKSWLASWLARRLAAVAAWRQESITARELASMNDHELMDIGLNRSDLPRVFDSAFSQEMRQRSTWS
jgi:uncharacterized protein YjiS (DUF1127 family)